MTIIRDRAAAAEASPADLVETYNAFSNRPPIKKFETRAIALARVDMVLMAAADAAGHAGVPKGATPQPMTAAEIEAKVATNPHKAGSMSAQLWDTAEKKEPIVAKAKKVQTETSTGTGRIPTFSKFRATGAGRTRLNATSTRAKILEWLVAQPKKSATVEEADAQFGFATRPFLQKMAAFGHVDLG